MGKRYAGRSYPIRQRPEESFICQISDTTGSNYSRLLFQFRFERKKIFFIPSDEKKMVSVAREQSCQFTTDAT